MRALSHRERVAVDCRYTSEVDIYSFGLLLLELVSLERPYAEYKTPAQLSQAVESGKLPLALEKVQDTDLVAIIQVRPVRDQERRQLHTQRARRNLTGALGKALRCK